MSDSIRVRFAPSPTGNVHIGNIRVAIFNWLYARHTGGKFLLRIEDTDLERSTPEAIANLIDAMDWLGLDYDESPFHQTAQRARHTQVCDTLLNLDLAYRNSDPLPAVVLKITKELFDPAFVTEPRETAEIDTSKAGELRGTLRSFVLVDKNSSSGQVFIRPIPWDTIETDLIFHLENGGTVQGPEMLQSILEKLSPNLSDEESCDINEIAESRVVKISFKRRFVYFDDLILGRMEKPLDSLKDLVIMRGDGSPVFHLANVVDDVTMEISHILRGNDHVENTYRHLFLYQAMKATPPKFGHLPMIVNAKGKPYSKRDGDAYVGDFRSKGFLPHALFNFLTLCGWNPGDDRESMTREELTQAFGLDRVVKTAAQFNLEKLEWLNGQLLTEMPVEQLRPLVLEALAEAECRPATVDTAWLDRVIEIERSRLKTVADFIPRTRYLFSEEVAIDFENKKVRKALKGPAVITTLTDLLERLNALADWTEEAIDGVLDAYVAEQEIGMGKVAQPLRIAATGGTVSPGIGETLV
ncbi:MAG: glutamate--tRNA ligase, partial [Planctomycetota bacterium]